MTPERVVMRQDGHKPVAKKERSREAMKKSQIKVFEELLEDKDFKGKKWLRHLLWLNTVKPKFKEGDCFMVSDSGHRVYGYPVKDFKAKVVDISSMLCNPVWRYGLQAEVECDGKQTTVMIYQDEHELSRAKKCKDNKNVLGAAVSDVEESLEV